MSQTEIYFSNTTLQDTSTPLTPLPAAAPSPRVRGPQQPQTHRLRQRRVARAGTRRPHQRLLSAGAHPIYYFYYYRALLWPPHSPLSIP